MAKESKELHSPDIPIDDLPPIHLSADSPFTRPPAPSFEAIDKPLEKDHTRDLAFAEEPVTVMLHPGNEEFSPMFRECWVNGIGVEVFDKGQWLVVGSLPVGIDVITKRKYVEVYARAKINTIKTVVISEPGKEPVNDIRRTPVHSVPLTIVHDANPRGREWFQRLMRPAA